MNAPFRLPCPLYAIVDVRDAGDDPVALAAAFLGGGARLLQLRWKTAATGVLVEAARAIAERCRSAEALLFVNDRVDVALAAGADGVHLGQDDLPADAARRIAGDRLRIGLSTHTVAQATDPRARSADYLAFGPIFATASKQTGYDPRGLEALAEIRRRACQPLVAIGGITSETAPTVLAAGADAVAMISALRTRDPSARVREILEHLSV